MDSQHYKFELLPLPYDYSALEPCIDTLTMEIHHNRHLKTYVDNLNNALSEYKNFHNWTLVELIYYSNRLPHKIRTTVKNNAGGVYNHNFYFYNMCTPNNEIPYGNLGRMINKQYGTYEDFKKEFKKQALGVFGSGYTWLVSDRNGMLSIVNTANQDTPLTMNLYPVMVIDVWEHAYYLKHYNKRADYIDDWFNVVNVDTAEKNYNISYQ